MRETNDQPPMGARRSTYCPGRSSFAGSRLQCFRSPCILVRNSRQYALDPRFGSTVRGLWDLIEPWHEHLCGEKEERDVETCPDE